MPDKKGYLPVLVGAAKNYKPGIEYQRDDEGKIFQRKTQTTMSLQLFIGLGKI